MSRIWCKGMSPRQLNKMMETNTGEKVYKGDWMPQMDRYWESDDGFGVMSRLVNTPWGKVEHASIMRISNTHTSDGTRDIPWKIKQEIKNELFGENRIAIEVFPKTDDLIDECDVYHLWIFEKNFEIPFGIHPNNIKQMNYINRGCSFTQADYDEYMKFKETQKRGD